MHLLVLICVLGLSQAQTTMTPTSGDGHDHTKPCCMPKRWQAALLDLRSDTTHQYATIMAYDVDLKKEGTLTVRIEDETPVYQTFTDYNTMMTYQVPMYGGDPSTHKCQSMPAAHDYYDDCFKGKDQTTMATAMAPQFLTESVWGPSMGGLAFHSWMLHLGTMNITIALSDDGCVPLLESITGMNNGKKIDSLLLFNDFSTNVTTPSLFSMPPACVKS